MRTGTHEERTSGLLRKGAVWALYAAALAPLVFSSRTIYPYVVPRAVFFRACVAVAAAVALYLLATRRRSLPGWRRDPFLLALAVFVAVLLVTALAGEAPMRSLFGDLERMGGVIAWVHFLAFYVAVRTLLTERDLTTFLWVILGVASVVSAIAILQATGVTVGILPGPEGMPAGVRGRAVGTLGNAGYLAIYALFGVAVGVLLVVRSEGVAGRVLAGLAILASASAMLLTGTRAALAGLAAGVVLALAAFLFMVQSRRRRAWTVAGVAGLLLVGAALAGSGLWTRGSDATRAPGRPGDASLLERSLGFRYAAWTTGARAVREHPLAGLGVENFRLAFDWHFEPERFRVATHYTRAHNDVVEYLVAGGIPGALAWVALWAAVFWSVVAGRREGALGAGETALLGGTFAAYLVYLLFWFHDQNSLPVFLILAAYVGTRRRGAILSAERPAPSAPRASVGGRVALGVVLVLALLADLGHHGRLLATSHYLLGAAASRDLDARIEAYERALDLRPPGAEEAVTEIVRFAVQLPGALGQRLQNPQARASLESVLERGHRAMADHLGSDPHNPRLHQDAGRLHVVRYQVSRNPAYLDSAVTSFERAIELAPGRLRYRHMLSEVHLMANRPEAAVRVLQEGLARYDGLGETHYFLAKALLVHDSHLEAAAALTRAYDLGYQHPNPAVHRVLVRELSARGEGEAANRVQEAWRAAVERHRRSRRSP